MQKQSAKMKDAITRFGKKVKRARESQNLSRQQLSDKLHINPLTIRNVEQGRTIPLFDTALILSAELDIKLDRYVESL